MENSLIPDLVAVLVTAGIATWVCQKLKISSILGYLTTGIIVGPFTQPILVSDIENIHTLANLGLVFVMFFIGLELSLKRLQALGLAPVLVTLLTALFIFNGTRLLGGAFGFDSVQSLFVAATIMVSSSVIVNRVFHELDVTREPFARSAMGVTLLEDTVAVSMLAILGSLGLSGEAGGAGQADVVPLLGRLAGFVLLAVVLALLFVPRLLNHLSRYAHEVMTVAVCGLLVGIAYLASSAGYSLALGAFLLGSVVGGTPHKTRFLQSFEGLHDIFAAVFFVSMGMLFDVSLLPSALPMALGLAVAAIIGRSIAALLAFLMAGKSLDFATRASMSLVPLGEFSFVIAQLGVSSGRMPDTFFPACVAAVLITTLLAPFVTRLGCKIGPRLEKRSPAFLRSWQNFLTRIGGALSQGRGEDRFRGKGLMKKCVQLGVEVALVLSALAFSGPISRGVLHLLNAFAVPAEEWLLATFDLNVPGHALFEVAFWVVFCLALLVPCVAIWHSLGAIGRILGEGLMPSAQDDARAPQRLLRQAIEKAVQAGGVFLFALLCGLVAPEQLPATGKTLMFVALIALVALLLRSPLARWQSLVREGLRAQVSATGSAEASEADSRRVSSTQLARAGAALASEEWCLHVRELTLKATSRAAGLTIGETELRPKFGCSIVAIERQGMAEPNPTAATRLFPDDLLLLVGTVEQLDQAEAWLNEASKAASSSELPFSELSTESVSVPFDFAHAGKTLCELEIASRFRVMVLGVEHDGALVQNPAGDHPLHPGDRLLVLGFPKENRGFQDWMTAETTSAATVSEGER